MNDDRTTISTKLLADGSNWVIFRDHMLWAIDSRGLNDHITSATITQPYIDAGRVGHLEAPQRWWRHHLEPIAAQTNRPLGGQRLGRARGIWQ